MSSRGLLVVAVLPEYRRAFLELVAETAKLERIELRAGDVHLVDSVRSAVFPNVAMLRNHGLLGRRVLWQSGALRNSINSDTVMVDLNPRSATAWVILLARRLLRKRTIVWGHLFPRAGANAPTARLRHQMRSLANGMLCYTWRDQERLNELSPKMPTWVAANALYRERYIRPAREDGRLSPRAHFIYVGRLVEEKRVDLLIRAFAKYIHTDTAQTSQRLVIVGDGPERSQLESLASELSISSRTLFAGQITSHERLRDLYADAICAVSPGSAGLNITQGLGFGVPLLVADSAQHGPEIELLRSDNSVFFTASDADSLADALTIMVDQIALWEARREDISRAVRSQYSAEIMAKGFLAAMLGHDG